MQKVKRWRSKSYLTWVAKQKCCLCGVCPAGEPHHIKGVGNFSGAGLKAPDNLSMPLCHGCHMHLHRTPSIWPEQWIWVATTMHKAIEEGILK